MAGRWKCLWVMVVLLVWSWATAGAANWVTLDDRSTATYQVDTDRIAFSGEESDKQLEVWMKTIDKNGSGTYMLSNYLVRENLNFILKERTSYSAVGQAAGSFQNTNLDKWTATTASSPIGTVASRLFADYHKNPEAFLNKDMIYAGQPETAVKSEELQSAQPTVNPQELKQALADNRINSGQNPDGTKWFYVRDTWSVYHFLSKEHMTADFWLIAGANTKYPRFNFSFNDARAGSHTIKETVVIKVDEREWVLNRPVTPGATSFPSAMFNYSFPIPDSLLQALLVTQNGVTVKWKHSWGGWKDYEYIIPVKIVHDIQLMYAGCK
jgi:hypothetical protein